MDLNGYYWCAEIPEDQSHRCPLSFFGMDLIAVNQMIQFKFEVVLAKIQAIISFWKRSFELSVT